MDPLAVIVLLVVMFTVAAVVIAVEDGRIKRGETTGPTTSHTGVPPDRR